MKLKYPVTFDSKKVEELTMRRAKVKDQIAIDKAGGSDAEKEVRLFAALCNVPQEIIEELDMADYTQLQKEYGDFLQ